MYRYSVRIKIVGSTLYCMHAMQKRYNCIHSTYRFIQTYYAPTTQELRANYETFTFVLRIKIRPLRYFLRLRLRRNTLRYVNFFLAPTVNTQKIAS